MTETAARKTFYLIDGHAQFFRAYHAIRNLSSPVTQEPTNATFGFTGMLIKLLTQYQPDYLAVAIDVSGDTGTFRSQIDPAYKAQREAPPEDFRPQVERMLELLGLFNIPVLGEEGYEADDVIATLVERFKDRDDLELRIVSRDKDLMQLLTDHVALFDVHKDETIDLPTLKKNKGVTPEQVVDMLALMGDTSDNIPGVPGIGEKTAAKLINQYGDLETLLAHTDELTPKQRENVAAHAERVMKNRRMVQLVRDLDLDFDLERARTQPPAVERLEPMFKQLGFERHLRDLKQLTGESATDDSSRNTTAHVSSGRSSDGDAGLFGACDAEQGASDTATSSAYQHADPADYVAITEEAQLKTLVDVVHPHDAPLSVDTETTGLNPMRAEMVGLSLAGPVLTDETHAHALGELAGKRGVYIPFRCADQPCLDRARTLEKLRPLLEDRDVPKVGQNIKYDLVVLRRHGIDLAGVAFDTMVASYLIDASRSSHKLDNLALAHLNFEMVPIGQLIGTGRKQKTFDTVPLDQATTYAAEDADVTLRLRDHFAPTLKAMGMRELFDYLEMPLVEVLAELEYNGILIDPEQLDQQRQALQQRIDDLRDRIIDQAPEPFNPDSPKQLADVLFKQLGCQAYRRTKTGPSTDSNVLQRIADEQEGPGAIIAELVLEYRQLTKLVGTYLQALADCIHPETCRIHASFNQTVAATGRLSSSDPNLQNIPIRTDLGRQIRKAFIAPPDHVLLAADYSQIELRILAHLSEDEGLRQAFNEGRDIHRAVAAEVFEVAENAVTDEQRGAAKMVNFGIVYGITPWGLARRLTRGAPTDADNERAKQIIDNYKQRYPKIDQFLEQCVHTAESKGYVETIMKRRRPIPEIASNRGNVYAMGKRMAINTVVQGSAADLIKLAMVNLHRRIRAERLPMKMLLQIHDELVLEMPESEAEAMAKIVTHEMQHAMTLDVPLEVEPAWGPNWFDTK